jgi:hypothetical protein
MPAPDAKDYALSRATLLTEGFKGLLVVNGGGAAALLAFISQVLDKSPKLAQLSFIGVAFMAVGLVLSFLVPFFRYRHSHLVEKREVARKTENLKTPYLVYVYGMSVPLRGRIRSRRFISRYQRAACHSRNTDQEMLKRLLRTQSSDFMH